MFSNRFLNKDRAVQERWFRLKMHEKFGQGAKSFLLWRLRRKLDKEFAEKEKIINGAIETIVKEYRRVDGGLFPATEYLFNMGLYFMLAERDVQALKSDALSHPNVTKRNIALRALLLTIYEWDMSKVTGKRMHLIYETTGLSAATKEELVVALRSLRSARKLIEDQLGEARHNAIAHRDRDALLQYKVISDLDVRSFSKSLAAFYLASDQLLKAMVSAMLEMGTTKSLYCQLSRQATLSDI